VYYGLKQSSDVFYSQNEHERRYKLTKKTVRERNAEDAKAEEAILMAEEDEEKDDDSDIFGDNWGEEETFEALPRRRKVAGSFPIARHANDEVEEESVSVDGAVPERDLRSSDC
jgi:hypothetical protein